MCCFLYPQHYDLDFLIQYLYHNVNIFETDSSRFLGTQLNLILP